MGSGKILLIITCIKLFVIYMASQSNRPPEQAWYVVLTCNTFAYLQAFP